MIQICSKMWKILNHKHQILNKFEYLNPKFKTNLSKESFTKERVRSFCHWDFGIWYCLVFRISSLGFIPPRDNE